MYPEETPMSTEEEFPDPIDRDRGLADGRRGGGIPRASRGGLFIQHAVPETRGTSVFTARAFVPLILALMVLPGAALAQMYRWVDEQGEVHVTDDPDSIPKQQRPRSDQMTSPTTTPAPSTTPAPPSSTLSGSADSGRRNAASAGGVALWLRTGGLGGEQEPVLIQVYDSEQACLAERDRRTAMHVSHGMQPTSQPGLAMLNIGRTPAGDSYFAYRCVPAGIRLS
jgi:hypothetical protein